MPTLFRKRLIPNECVELKDDQLIYADERIIVTNWQVLHPRKRLHHGSSIYYLKDGYKISRFLDANDQLIRWYCDIIDWNYDAQNDTHIFTDLLADIILDADGTIKVVDLDELAAAFQEGLLSDQLLQKSLITTDALLKIIYNGNFHIFQEELLSFLN